MSITNEGHAVNVRKGMRVATRGRDGVFTVKDIAESTARLAGESLRNAEIDVPIADLTIIDARVPDPAAQAKLDAVRGAFIFRGPGDVRRSGRMGVR